MPKFPDIRVAVADGAPRAELIARVAAVLPAAAFVKMRELGFPSGYAMTVDYIREWVDTD